MLPTPTQYTMATATAEGLTRLTAFDKALLGAGVGNCNLLKVSSILPPGALYVPKLFIPEGSLLPIAYASVISDIPEQMLCAGVAVGIGDADEYGVIMEYHGIGSQKEAEERLESMVQEAFDIRGRELLQIRIAAVQHEVEKCGCAFAAIPLWYS